MSKSFAKPVLGLVLGLSMLFAFSAAPASAASKVPSTVRVVTTSGKILVDKKLKTGTTKVKSSSKAGCFGPGSSNASKSLTGPTALGLLSRASEVARALRPLSITNASDFGLGVCGIGGFDAAPTGFWLLKVNHADSSLGAEATVLKKNDVTLWYQVADYTQPSPDELYLKARSRVKKGKKVKVRVLGFDSKGKKKPVEGASLSVGGSTTNSKGYTKVEVSKKTRIVARKTDTIPSNRVLIKIKK